MAKPCNAEAASMADPQHTHTCTGEHDAGDHFCGVCKRWWWVKQ